MGLRPSLPTAGNFSMERSGNLPLGRRSGKLPVGRSGNLPVQRSGEPSSVEVRGTFHWGGGQGNFHWGGQGSFQGGGQGSFQRGSQGSFQWGGQGLTCTQFFQESFRGPAPGSMSHQGHGQPFGQQRSRDNPQRPSKLHLQRTLSFPSPPIPIH